MRIPGPRLVGSLLVGLALFAGSTARAADPDTERARALYDEAGELERRGQWGVAQEKLRAALRLRETAQLRFALGWALENDDKLLEAKAEYEAAARMARESPAADEAGRLATARLADLAERMPVLKVRIAGAPKRSARLVVDGREIERDDEGATTSVNPGSHVLRVERTADGSSLVEQVVYVGRGMARTVDVDLTDAVTQSTSVQDRHERAVVSVSTANRANAQDKNIVPWIVLSGGIAGIAGGAALLVSSASDASERDDMHARWCTATACNGTTATRAESAEAAGYRQASTDAAHAGNTKQAFGFVIGGAGVIATTIGAVLLFRSSDRPSENARSSTGRSTPPLRVRASIAPTMGGGFASAAMTF